MEQKETRLQIAYKGLERVWRYVAETLLEILIFVLLLVAGVFGFVPWLIWNGVRLIGNHREKGGDA